MNVFVFKNDDVSMKELILSTKIGVFEGFEVNVHKLLAHDLRMMPGFDILVALSRSYLNIHLYL